MGISISLLHEFDPASMQCIVSFILLSKILWLKLILVYAYMMMIYMEVYGFAHWESIIFYER